MDKHYRRNNKSRNNRCREYNIYIYASIKYKEEQDKTFYYISNIEDLNIGDYVWVSVRNEQVPGIVVNIEKFAYNNVPFPIKRTKTIIRKSTRQEYEQYHKKFGVADRLKD